MAKPLVSPEQKVLIEKLGVLHEKSGIQPAAARVLSLLLVSDNPELTFEEIIDALGISKSAASNAINLLLNINRLEYVTKPGERKRYFRTRLAQWEKSMREELEGWVYLADVLKDVLKQRPGNTIEINTKLHELISFLEFLHQEMPILYAEWEKRKKAG